MTRETQNPEWKAGHWLVMIVLLSLLLGGSVKWLTRWPALPPATSQPHPGYVFAGLSSSENASDDLAGDPAGFALPDPHGFSGAATRQLPRNAYEVAEFRVTNRWLVMDGSARRLGEPLPLSVIRPSPDRLPVPTLPLSIQPAPLVAATTSISVDEAFSGRALTRAPEVPANPGEVLQAVVVEVGVNHWGHVVSARVVGSSGSAAADKAALDASRTARFVPLPGRPKSVDAVLTDLQWGRFIFTWGGGAPLR